MQRHNCVLFSKKYLEHKMVLVLARRDLRSASGERCIYETKIGAGLKLSARVEMNFKLHVPEALPYLPWARQILQPWHCVHSYATNKTLLWE